MHDEVVHRRVARRAEILRSRSGAVVEYGRDVADLHARGITPWTDFDDRMARRNGRDDRVERVAYADAAALRRVPRQTVGMTDGQRGEPHRTLRAVRALVSGAVARLQTLHIGHACLQMDRGTQRHDS